MHGYLHTSVMRNPISCMQMWSLLLPTRLRALNLTLSNWGMTFLRRRMRKVRHTKTPYSWIHVVTFITCIFTDKLEEDEVNVLYVAVTRARRNLILSKDLALFLAIKMKVCMSLQRRFDNYICHQNCHLIVGIMR